MTAETIVVHGTAPVAPVAPATTQGTASTRIATRSTPKPGILTSGIERSGSTAGATGATVDIRPAREHEYAAIGELTHAAYAHDYPVSESYARVLRHPESRLDLFDVWVAEDAATGTLLGTTSILRPGAHYERRVDGELYFRLLAVSPDARRRGIGAALTNFADDVARDRGLTAVSLNSAQHMTVAHSLYRALGFTRVQARDVHIVDGGEHRVVYTFVRAVR